MAGEYSPVIAEHRPSGETTAFDPAAYVEAIREPLRAKAIATNGGKTRPEIAAAVVAEAERADAFITERVACHVLDQTFLTPDEISWIRDGFTSNAARLARVSFRAAKLGAVDTPLTELPPAHQD